MTRRTLLASAAASGLASSLPAAETSASLALHWGYVADTVMGGVSTGRLTRARLSGTEAARLTGEVSTANNGGFIQIAADLPEGVDAAAWSGIEIDVIGNGEIYDLRLRTTALTRPWQSYRLSFEAPSAWGTLRASWDSFAAHRTSAPFDPAELRRIGVLAIGREFRADIAVGAVRLWR
ncbi:CIA30 family protein [Jannaschia seohaensis]|uniref:Complex I intermediate-associated protein 30 (CIA30) n=1 Tax=Jannaschia seohaensis TaxID=475081 RepID=A0A2Y9ABN9_9RHOB|nr:CIA30 family protein [Jannaschia seohaensis]PWJ21290.1 complex I intermediate-associated protein 30 (CIA30) [Jannaschia seohaensis]SSA41700.1 Complex I intermediate-associated protein 30 (CIA30) [Jannaschia seohaensis]